MGTGDGSLGNEVLWSLPLANVSGSDGVRYDATRYIQLVEGFYEKI